MASAHSARPRTRRTNARVAGFTAPPPPAAQDVLSQRLRNAALPARDASVREIAAIKQEIAADLAPYDAMKILANLVALTVFQRPSRDPEPAATVEYVASILLERQGPGPITDAVTPDESGAIQRTLDRTRGLTLHSILRSLDRAAGAPTALDALAEHLQSLDVVVRWPGYEPQLNRLLDACFSDEALNNWLARELGFTPADARRCIDAVERLLEEQFNAWGARAAQRANAQTEAYDTGAVELPREMQAPTAEQRAQRGWWMLAQHFFSDGLIEALTLTMPELSARASVSEVEAEAFVDAFAVPWGSLRGLTLVTGTGALRFRPLVRGSDGRVLLTSPGNLAWALRPALERALKRNQGFFNIYQEGRARYAERETADQMRIALKPDWLGTNLEFETKDGNGEADVLVVVDDLLLVVEVKSGELSDAARSGRRRDLREDLEQLVGKGSRQVARLASVIADGATPEFFERGSRRRVEVPLARVRRIEAAVVTIEDLSVVASHSDALQAAVLGNEVPLPWIVNLHSLETIARTCEYVAQLTGYLAERRALDPRVEWIDEDDLWATHLLASLDCSRIKGRVLLVDGRTEELERLWLTGARPPRMKTGGATRKALKRLQRERRPGWLTQSEQLLADARRGRRPRVVVPPSG